MGWAADRQTTRLEDTAYCLLGIFDVNMPLIYGEGRKAFRRLQLEIIKANNDPTILAWEPPPSGDAEEIDTYPSPYMGLLAQSPLDFAATRHFYTSAGECPEFSVTNKGLVISPDIPLHIRAVSGEEASGEQYSSICLGYDGKTRTYAGIRLKKIGPGLFCRERGLPLVEFPSFRKDTLWTEHQSNYCVTIDPSERSMALSEAFRQYAMYVSATESFRITRVVPERLWDPDDKVFLRPRLDHSSDVSFDVTIGIWFQEQDADGTLISESDFVVLFKDSKDDAPSGAALVREWASLDRLRVTLFSNTSRGNSFPTHQMNEEVPGIAWQPCLRWHPPVRVLHVYRRPHVWKGKNSIGLVAETCLP